MVNLPKRCKKYGGVGKFIGGNLYIHRDYTHRLTGIAKCIFDEIHPYLHKNFDYDMVKINFKQETVTFIKSPDFDYSDEPISGNGVMIRLNGSEKHIHEADDPWIYHHKWLFVDDDYDGFDVEESKRRSERWLSLPNLDMTRIGKQLYWKKLMKEYNL